MIDHFHKITNRLRKLKSVVIIMAVIFLIIILGIIFLNTHQEEFFLIPCIVGFLWCLLAYAFLIGFQYMPNKANENNKFFARMKVKFYRFLYWLFGVGFIVISIVMIILSVKMIAVWGRDYIV